MCTIRTRPASPAIPGRAAQARAAARARYGRTSQQRRAESLRREYAGGDDPRLPGPIPLPPTQERRGVVSGRRNHPAAPPPADQLTALAGRLTAGDRQVCRLLADHQVLTTGLLALLLGTPPRTLQQRLTTLTTLKVVDRFRPHQPVGAGSAPYHYLLGEAGAAVLAADASATADRPGWDRAQLAGLAHANGRLTHLLAVNTVFAQLTHTARHRAGTRLVCWWPAGRCQARWGRLIAPDAYVRWQDPDGEVDFFLHHHPYPTRSRPARPPARGLQRPGRGHRHHHPRAAVRRRSRPGSPAASAAHRPAAAGPGGHQQPGLRATHRPGVAADQQPRWRPAVSARRARPPRPLASHPTSHGRPTRRRTPPGGRRPVEGPAGWR